MTDIYLLNGRGCSGRAVKIRELSAEEVDKCAINASKIMGDGATNAEYGITKHREMNFAAVVGVTTIGNFKTLDEVLAAGPSAWAKLSPLILEQSGPLSYASLFRAKDDAVISGIVQRLHFVSGEDIEAIMGKALSVSED